MRNKVEEAPSEMLGGLRKLLSTYNRFEAMLLGVYLLGFVGILPRWLK